MDQNATENPKKNNKALPNLLQDDRFKVMFEDPNYETDFNSVEYALLNPVISQLSKKKKPKEKKKEESNDEADEYEGKNL